MEKEHPPARRPTQLDANKELGSIPGPCGWSRTTSIGCSGFHLTTPVHVRITVLLCSALEILLRLLHERKTRSRVADLLFPPKNRLVSSERLRKHAFISSSNLSVELLNYLENRHVNSDCSLFAIQDCSTRNSIVTSAQLSQ